MDKINTIPTKDVIAAQLRDAILSGSIADSEELTQTQLAERLGVSRMPVREAIQMLEQGGLLLRLPNRHIRVVGISADTVADNMRLVAAVESEVAGALLRGKKDTAQLAGILSQYGEAHRQDNPAGCRQAEARFHYTLSNLTGNPYLRQIHQKLLGVYPQYIWDHCDLDYAVRQPMLGAIVNAMELGKEHSIAKAVSSYYLCLGTRLTLDLGHREHAHEQSLQQAQ